MISGPRLADINQGTNQLAEFDNDEHFSLHNRGAELQTCLQDLHQGLTLITGLRAILTLFYTPTITEKCIFEEFFIVKYNNMGHL